MEEQLIIFKTAKLAKEKGFNWQCRDIYLEDGMLLHLRAYNHLNYIIEGENEDYTPFSNTDITKILNSNYESFDEYTMMLKCTAPTQSLLQKWLREVHNIHIDIRINQVTHPNWFLSIFYMNTRYGDVLRESNNYKTYEEALEKGLQESLKMIEI